MEREKTIKLFETIWPQLNRSNLRCVIAYAEGMLSMIPSKNEECISDENKQKEIV